MTNRVTRLAPSPTGALHLGNARTFLINWAMARRSGWQILMRIEDLDGPRIKSHASDEALKTLQWLGIDFDGEPLYQSADLTPYIEAVRRLDAMKLIYACNLSRREIEAASTAPHKGDHELHCPADLRPADPSRFRFDQRDQNYRLCVEDELITVHDEISGAYRFNPYHECGDFVVWTKRAAPAYQLAVVVDDARQGVTDVVRGDDLLPSAARQMLLDRSLNLPAPRWWHLPLVLGPDGRRLAKRHGDTRVKSYREAGVRPQRIIGLLAAWSGIEAFDPYRMIEMSAKEFCDSFDPAILPRSPVVFTEAYHSWLLR